jgi:hypothetical protein
MRPRAHGARARDFELTHYPGVGPSIGARLLENAAKSRALPRVVPLIANQRSLFPTSKINRLTLAATVLLPQ